MATDLRERLTDLAAQTPHSPPPADLWRRGVRRRRVTQAGGAAAVAVLVLLLGAGGLVWHLGHEPVQPAAPQGAAQLPDQFYQPSPWLHPFDGDPGQLVAVGEAERKTLFHTTQGVYGITAAGGRYGFLDLPGLYPPPVTSGDSFALSPDGDRLAYWVSGRVPADDVGGAAIGGVAVRDLVTGESRTWRVPSSRGLAAGYLAWSDEDTLVLEFGRWAAHSSESQGGTSDDYRAYVWVWGRPSPRPLVERHYDLDGSQSTPSFGRIVAPATDRPGFWIVHPRDPSASRRVRGMGDGYQTAISPDGLRAARPDNTARTPTGVSVFRIPPSGTDVHAVAGRRLGSGVRAYEVITWTDRSHVIVTQRMAGAEYRQQLVSIEVGSGTTTPMVAPYQGQALATGLLTAPSVRATPPPTPLDLRWTLGLLGVGAAVVGFFVWGLRVRRT